MLYIRPSARRYNTTASCIKDRPAPAMQVHTSQWRKALNLIQESLRNEERSYTSGSIDKAILLLSIPMVLEMMMESLFALVDAFFVSKVSSAAVATVGLTETVTTLIYAIALGISLAPMAIISRYVGEGRQEAAASAARQAILLALSIGIPMSLLGWWLAPGILQFMGASDTMIAEGANYPRIIYGSNVIILLLFLLNGIFRGAGDANLAMRTLWLSNGINIVLDPLLIFGWGPFPAMGIEGAALATAIGRSAGVAYQLYALFSGKSRIDLRLGSWWPDWPVIGKLANIASTGALQHIIASASWIFIVRIISGFGHEAVAGYTIAIRLIIFTLLPAWGLSNAAATLVGQNLGAGQPERAESSVWRAGRITFIYTFLLAIAYLVLAPALISAFDDTASVVSAGVTALSIFAIGYPLFGYGMICMQSFNGAGDTRTPTIINFVCFWMIEIPLGYLMGHYWNGGVAGVVAAVVFSESIMAFASMYYFRKGRWKLIKL